jgi:copper(I)-binding protein
MRGFQLRIAVASVVSSALLACGALAGDVTVSGGWFRSLPSFLPTAGYFTLHNGRDKPIVLKTVASPACGMLMVHRSVHNSGMEYMLPAGELDVPAGGTLVFAPDGLHLMCTERSSEMKLGSSVPVTFEFADGSSLTSEFTVRSAAGN